MRTREGAIMNYTRRMGELDGEHTEALTTATQNLLEYLQTGNRRSKRQIDEAEEKWRTEVWLAYQYWKEGRAKTEALLDAALAADPAIES